MTLLGRRGLTAALVVLGVVTVAACLLVDLPPLARYVAAAGAAIAYGLLVRLVRGTIARRDRIIEAVADGVAGLRDGDYSVSVAAPRDDVPLRRLVENYNGIGTRLRAQRQDLYQRELLLDTVIQATPLALVLTNSAATVLYGNLAARHLFRQGQKIEGLSFPDLLERMPTSRKLSPVIFAPAPRPRASSVSPSARVSLSGRIVGCTTERTPGRASTSPQLSMAV